MSETTSSREPPEAAEPPCGRFEWGVRAVAPGLDVSAIDARAVQLGFLPDLSPGEHPPARYIPEPTAGPMALAFASAYDALVAYRLGLSSAPAIPNVEGLLAFGFAACCVLAVRFDPDDEIRTVPRGDAE